MSSLPKVDRLLQNFKELFLNGQDSDVILKVKNREFPVHRGILTVRSPVFACMFHHDTQENVSGIVNIPDCSAEAFEILLLYLYTGNINNLSSENAFSVYYVADKYCVDDLKDHIIEFLKDNLTLENFFDVFTLSLCHSDLELQKLTSSFFCENIKAVVKTDHWKKHMKENPAEVNALFRKSLECLKIEKI